MAKILVVDDEPNIVEVIRLYLEHANFSPVIQYSGQNVMQIIEQEQPILIILDVMLPEMTGLEVCQRIRDLPSALSQTPIIMLTAKGESMDKLRGFNLGVDDYIVKPFDPNELIARIKAVLKRTQFQKENALSRTSNPSADDLKKKVLTYANLSIDLDQYKVTIDGIKMELTPKEIELLYFLADHPRRVYTREDLLLHVWHFDFVGGTRTVDAHVKNLRKKLGSHEGWTIQTLWGIGYAFEVRVIA